MRVYQLAEKLEISSKQLLKRLKCLHVDAKSHMSSLDEETAELVMHELVDSKELLKEKEELLKTKKEIFVNFPITVKQLSIKFNLKPSQFMQKLIKMGIMANINQTLEKEVMDKVGKNLGYTIRQKLTQEEELLKLHKTQEEGEKLELRAPVVTLMGHVDHGKTSLLEVIRKISLLHKEKGGITQHIGAYQIMHNSKKITFLDTPGHKAFTAMRARGANVTDIAILVVAADDGVMPQTVEAIDHARAAGVSIIVAINKVDKPEADIDKVKKQLCEYDLTPEDWGGKTVTVPVSAKTQQGIDGLLEMILLEAEMLELKANPDKAARGRVLEGKLTRRMGSVTTLLIQSGLLKIGDVIVAGEFYGRIKLMLSDTEIQIKQAETSTPVEMIGLNGVPDAGDDFFVVLDEKKAQQIVISRAERKREGQIFRRSKVTLESLHKQMEGELLKNFRLIIKTDVQGSLEVLEDSIKKIPSQQIKISIIHKGVGNITESDAMLASASNAIIIGFGVGLEPKAKIKSQEENIDIRIYEVIYNAIDDIGKALEGLLEPIEEEVDLGKAEVRQIFKVSNVGTTAGCIITEGNAIRGAYIRIVRGGKVVKKCKISSLKRFKDDVKEVQKGFECGIGFGEYQDIEVGDKIEVFEKKISKR